MNTLERISQKENNIYNVLNFMTKCIENKQIHKYLYIFNPKLHYSNFIIEECNGKIIDITVEKYTFYKSIGYVQQSFHLSSINNIQKILSNYDKFFETDNIDILNY